MNEQFNSIKIHGINNTKTVNAQKANIIHNYKNATDKIWTTTHIHLIRIGWSETLGISVNELNLKQNKRHHANAFSLRCSVKGFALMFIYYKHKCTVRKLQTRHPRGLRRSLSATALITRSWVRNPRRALVMSASFTFLISCAGVTLRRDDLSTKQSYADQISLNCSPFHYNYTAYIEQRYLCASMNTAPWRHVGKWRVPCWTNPTRRNSMQVFIYR